MLIDNAQRMDTRLAVDLKVFRRRSGLSQAEVAHLLGIHRSQLSKFERGTRQPSMEHVTILCLIYGMRAPDFCVAALPQFENILAERLQVLLGEIKQPSSELSALVEKLETSRSTYDD